LSDVEIAMRIIQAVGIPTILALLWGPPSLLVVYFCIKDWRFTGRFLELLTKIETLLEDGRK